jgi:Zn ribbon nucleic-acid-binding protein
MVEMVTKAPEVGGELEAYCTKCKADTGHIIVALSGENVKRVECKACSGHHNYRKPKSAAAAPKTKKSTTPRPRRTAAAAPPMDPALWDEQLRARSTAPVRDYHQQQVFGAGELIAHSTFGLGRVEEVLRNKMRVAFRAGPKTLICKDKAS